MHSFGTQAGLHVPDSSKDSVGAESVVHRPSGSPCSCVTEIGTHIAGSAESRGDTQVQFKDEVVDTSVVVNIQLDQSNYQQQKHSAPATRFNVSVTHHNFPQHVQAHFISSVRRLAQETQTFCLHDPRNSRSREWTKAQVGASQRSVYGELEVRFSRYRRTAATLCIASAILSTTPLKIIPPCDVQHLATSPTTSLASLLNIVSFPDLKAQLPGEPLSF